jgi:hypothetical protein
MKNIHLIPTDKPSRLHLGNSGLVLCDFKFGKNTINGQNIYITSDEEIKEGDWVYHYASHKMFKYDGNGLCVEVEKIILTTDQDLIKNGVQAIDDEFLEWFVKNPSCEEVEVERGFLTFTGWVKSKETVPKNLIRYKIIIPQEEPNKIHYLDELPNIDKKVLAKMWADAMPKYPIGGYAPGLYSCVCVSCKKEFMGDKRAVQCEPCAIEMVNTKITINDKRGIETVKKETLEEVIEREEYPKGITQEIWEDGVRLGAKWQQDKMYSEEEVLELLQKALTHKDNGETGNLITTQGEIRTANFYSWFEQFKKK